MINIWLYHFRVTIYYKEFVHIVRYALVFTGIINVD